MCRGHISSCVYRLGVGCVGEHNLLDYPQYTGYDNNIEQVILSIRNAYAPSAFQNIDEISCACSLY